MKRDFISFGMFFAGAILVGCFCKYIVLPEAKRDAFTIGARAGIDFAVQLISTGDSTHCPCDFTSAEIDSILEAAR